MDHIGKAAMGAQTGPPESWIDLRRWPYMADQALNLLLEWTIATPLCISTSVMQQWDVSCGSWPGKQCI